MNTVNSSAHTPSRLVGLEYWVFSFVVALGVALTILLFSDDPINEDAKYWLEKYSQGNLENSGSVYQLGVYLKGEGKPYERGLTFVSGQKTNLIQIEELQLTEPHNQLLCQFDQPECISYLLDNAALAVDIIEANKQLFEDFKGLYHYSRFTILTPAGIEYLKPDRQFIGDKIQQTNMIYALHLARSGQAREAVNLFRSLINYEYQVLAQTPYMVEKGKALITLERAALLFPYLYRAVEDKKLWGYLSNIFPPYSDGQKSMKKVMAYEFVWSAKLIEHTIENEPDLYAQLGTFNLFYNRNKTINLIYEYLLEGVETEELLDRWNFYGIEMSKNHTVPLDITNPLGSFIAATARPSFVSFDEHITRANRLNDLIKILYANSEGVTDEGLAMKVQYVQNTQVCLADETDVTDICLNLPSQ